MVGVVFGIHSRLRIDKQKPRLVLPHNSGYNFRKGQIKKTGGGGMRKLVGGLVLLGVFACGLLVGGLYRNESQADDYTIHCNYNSASFIQIDIITPVPITKLNRYMFDQRGPNTFHLVIWYNQ